MMRKFMLLAAVAGLMMGTGCKGGEGGDKKEGEKAEAPSKSNHDKWQGTWGINIDKMIEMDPKMQEQLKENPGMKAMLEGMMGNATITVGKDTLSMKMGPKEEKATYKVVKEDGNKLIIESKDEGKEETEKLTIEFTDDKNVIMSKEGDDEKMALVRK